MFSKPRLPEKQLVILTNVGTWGYLTTREIALLGWPTITPKAALKAAQLATTDLRKDGLLLTRTLPLHGRTSVFVLTQKGADVLNNELLQLAFTAGYDLEISRQHMRSPVLAMAATWVREKGLMAVGQRGLAHDLHGLRGFKSLDGLLVDPDTMSPAFGILLVRGFDKQTVERVKKASRLSVPCLIAGADYDRKCIETLIKVRAATAPDNEDHLQWNKPAGLLC